MKVIRSIVSLLLAVLVLVSSTSFTVSMHLCRGHIKDIAVLKEAAPCAMERMAAELNEELPCAMHGESVGRNGCCENKTIAIDGNEYNYKYEPPVKIPVITYTEAASLVSAIYISDHPSSHSSFTQYRPPAIHYDIPVLIQSFRL